MKIDLEWEEAPGVRDPVLAATWARFSIQIGNQCLTEGLSLASGSIRQSIYGSVFPIAEWLVENWWSLFYETRPSHISQLAKVSPFNAEWIRRHDLVAGREGFALPECLIFSDEEYIKFEWYPDAIQLGQRLRFVGQGVASLERKEVIEAFSEFITKVLARLEDVLGFKDHFVNESCSRIFGAWTAIQHAEAEEQGVCRVLGTLGLDPYDPAESSDAFLNLAESVAQRIPEGLGVALAAGSGPSFLEPNYYWVQSLYDRFKRFEGLGYMTRDHSKKPFEEGYVQARQLRSELGKPIDPIANLSEYFGDHRAGAIAVSKSPAAGVSIQGFLGQEMGAALVLSLPQSAAGLKERFSLARATYFALTQEGSGPPALLTEAPTWSQQASRAFAAEFLAPATALALRIGRRVTEDEVHSLAEEFQVSPTLVRHQIENHDLACLGSFD